MNNEAMRFERLRAQDGKPLVPPPAMLPLCKDGGLDPMKENEAASQWQAAKGQMQAAPSYPTEERLFWTTWLLARHYAEKQQRPRLAPMINEVLPLLQQARHQQVLLGMLARNQAAMGDVDGAAALLPRLDAQSEDLQIDTSYRFTTAYIALIRNDAQTALSVLGWEIDDVPISDAYDLVCGVYRAHAHELTGNIDLAKAQLQRVAGSPQKIAAVESIIAVTPQIPLLRHSLPQVKKMVAEIHGNAIATDSGINVGRLVLVPILGSFAAIGASGLAAEMLDPPLSEIVPGVLIAVLVIGILGITFGTILKGPRMRKQLMATGVRGTAQLMVVEQTGTRVNDQPMLRLRMLVSLPNQPQYSVVHNEIVPQIRLAHVQPGVTLQVVVDPNDKKKMAIAWQ